MKKTRVSNRNNDEKYSEFQLTNILIDSLLESRLSKITSPEEYSETYIGREINSPSFITDICIAGSKSKTTLRRFDNEDVDFIAIEVKISDWVGGLYQAWRYTRFAEKSFLAIYSPFLKRVNINEFRNRNIGLISFDEFNTDVIVSPSINRFRSNTHEEAMRSRIYSNVLNAKDTLPYSYMAY